MNVKDYFIAYFGVAHDHPVAKLYAFTASDVMDFAEYYFDRIYEVDVSFDDPPLRSLDADEVIEEVLTKKALFECGGKRAEKLTIAKGYWLTLKHFYEPFMLGMGLNEYTFFGMRVELVDYDWIEVS